MIRNSKKEDIINIMDIWIRSNINAHNFINSTYFYDNFEFVKEIIQKSEVYVYEIKDNVVGFIGLEEGFIQGIFVDEKYRSKGIGKKLITFCKGKHDRLSLNVYCKNKRAIQFYKREGFKIYKKMLEKENNEYEYVMKWQR